MEVPLADWLEGIKRQRKLVSMSPPAVRSAAKRLRELIDEGQEIARLERPASVGAYIQGQDAIPLQAWLVNVTNIIESTFGPSSAHSRHLHELMPDGPRLIQHSYQVYTIVGLLDGALGDLEGGFLYSQTLLVAGEVFDSIIEEAAFLLDAGHKDPAAVLARVVLEDALRRIAESEGADTSTKPSRINDDLKAKGRYPQPQWRQVRAWLDIGNSAAHGRFDEFSSDEVSAMIEGITRFLVAELRAR